LSVGLSTRSTKKCKLNHAAWTFTQREQNTPFHP
jgi:hypothetical protein